MPSGAVTSRDLPATILPSRAAVSPDAASPGWCGGMPIWPMSFSATVTSLWPDLTGAGLFRVRFIDCRLSGASLSEASLQHVAAERCRAEYAGFAQSRMWHVHFAGCDLSGGAFAECRFEQVAFSECRLAGAEFFGTRLRGISLADSDIRGIRIREISSVELNGLKVNALQACDLARLLGIEIEG